MRTLIVLALTALAVAASAAPLQFALKGRVLGATELEACGQAVVTEYQPLLDAAGSSDVLFPASSCDVEFGTVARVAVDGPARLLFWRGRLIRVIVHFGRLDPQDVASLRGALVGLYQSPSTKRQSPFITDVWRAGSRRLELERTQSSPTNTDLFLTESTDWSEYDRASERATAAMAAVDRRRRREDVSTSPR